MTESLRALDVAGRFWNIPLSEITMTALGRGGQSSTFVAERIDGLSPPIVVKIFNRRYENAAAREFSALVQAHATLNGQVVDGWRLSVPAAHALYGEARAIVMSLVPGRPISSLLQAGYVLQEVPEAVAKAFELFWERSRDVYGDATLDNLLLSGDTREISFIDAGAPNDTFYCRGVSRAGYPRSRDVAYLLFAASVQRARPWRVSTGNGRIAMDRFITAFLGTVLSSPASREALCQEIEACAAEHAIQIERTARPLRPWRYLARGTYCPVIHNWVVGALADMRVRG